MNQAIHSFQRRSLALALGLTFLGLNASADPDAAAILKSSDQARGGGLPGLVWEVFAHNTGTGAEEFLDQKLRVKATDLSSVAEVLEPASSKGGKILQVERNMWITKPGLKKPVAISPRQRLTGQAAIGDIAATNYAKDYSARFIGEEMVANEKCYVLDLSSINRQSTYDRITYWVSIKRSVAIKADFLSLSGKKLKSAEFDYDNTISIQGRALPFVSRMSIADALTDARTTLEFSRVRVQNVPSSEFDVGNLQ